MPVCPHIETSQFNCFANKLTGFYVKETLAFTGLSFLSSLYIFDKLIELKFDESEPDFCSRNICYYI